MNIGFVSDEKISKLILFFSQLALHLLKIANVGCASAIKIKSGFYFVFLSACTTFVTVNVKYYNYEESTVFIDFRGITCCFIG